ncbi:Tc toxin subunit A [Enterobacter ludwigii]
MIDSVINIEGQKTAQSVSSLLKDSIPEFSFKNIDVHDIGGDLLKALINLGYFSVFDITRPGRSRFIKRHDHQLLGCAGEIYDRAASFTCQIVQQHRKTKSRYPANTNNHEVAARNIEHNLPSYAELFPESWLDYCRDDVIESVVSPVSYLVDLYRFVHQIELDANNKAVTLIKRRPDILQLPLNNDTTYQEISELELVNHILMSSIQNTKCIERQDVYEQLNAVRYPYALPYSFATHQIHLGLAAKESSLNQIVKNNELHKALPWEETKEQRNRFMVSASKLSLAENTLLSEPAFFSTYQVNAKQLLNGYLSGSTTEILPDVDLRNHAYVVPPQDNVIDGPTKLVTSSILDNTLSSNYDTITVTCTNADGEHITVTLKGESIITYQRLKARMVKFGDSDAPLAYSRQLRLSNNIPAPQDPALANGPYYSIVNVKARTYSEQLDFTSFSFALALAPEGTPEEKLWPDAVSYFRDNYGIEIEQYPDLKKVAIFAQTVSGNVEEIEKMLSQGNYRPQVSPNITFDNTVFTDGQSLLPFPDTYHYGAKYVNNSQPKPQVIVIYREGDEGGREITNTSASRYERMNRFLRFVRWSDLPADKLDLLLTSAMQAAGTGTTITDHTIRAYGLYCYLNDRYSISPESYSAILDKICVYSISPEYPFFDQIFNKSPLFDVPFIQDGGVFIYTDSSDLSVKQICSGLSISTTTFLQLAPLVSQAFGFAENTLKRTAPVLSALYRLVKLPAMFDVSPEEGLALCKIMSKVLNLNLSESDTWDEREYAAFMAEFLIHPKITDDDWDTLHIIYVFEQLTIFGKNSGINPSELTLLLNTESLPLVATNGMLNFFNSITQQLNSDVLLSKESFQRQDLPDITPDNWMDVLSDLLDINGLVKPYPLVWAQTDAEYLQHELVTIVKRLGITGDVQVTTVGVLEQIISQAKSAQDSLAATAIANEYGIARELVTLMLRWCDSSVTDLCSKLLSTGLIEAVEDIPQRLFDIAYHLLQRVLVVSRLGLSADALFLRLTQPDWLGLPFQQGVSSLGELSLNELWLLNDYHELLKNTSYTEEEVQDYFTNTNLSKHNEEALARECADMLAGILAWDSHEILDATRHLANLRAKSMLQVRWLRHVQALGHQTGLSAQSVILTSGLTGLSTPQELKVVGDAVVAAAKEQSDAVAEQLATSLRDALVGYYLGQLVPYDDDMEPYRSRITTVDELYDFLLLDTQVSYKVKSAGVAQATKSLQQYINRITLNLESGLNTTQEEVINWREFASRYGYWAANQQLKIYPEIYIDPTLRLGKTDLFHQFESVLNQGKLNNDTVQQAVMKYLNDFEEVSNLELLSGYETGINIDEDKIYLVAKTRTQPYSYYWRSLDMTQGMPATLTLYPGAWSDWEKIDLSLEAAEPRTVRAILMNGRLYISWLETAEEKDDNDVVKGFKTKLLLAYYKFDGGWTTPNIVRESTLSYQMTDLIAVLDTTRSENQLMLIAYTLRTGNDKENGNAFYDYDEVFAFACDSMLAKTTDFPPSGNPAFSDIDYYAGKLVWFYTRENGNLYKGGNIPPVATTPEQALARQDVARQLVLYPIINELDFIISDPTLIAWADNEGRSGDVGKEYVEQVVSFTNGNINSLTVNATSKNYHYFIDPNIVAGNKLDTILFCTWVWRSKGDGTTIQDGELYYVNYQAYKLYAEEGCVAFPENGDITLISTIELQPGWDGIVIQSGFSLVKTSDDWTSAADPGGRITSTYYTGKEMRPLVQIKRSDKVEYLQFPDSYNATNNGTIRLNTLFAKELIARATQGIEYVLAWEAQNIMEPPITENNISVPIDFSGANGIYFWELFFHMPFLVAWRLNTEQRYGEAVTWMNYIFNPNESEDEPMLLQGKPRYWNSRPVCLQEETLGRALMEPSDPDAIAESDPVHYRKAIFRFYVDNLIATGDMDYRQQSPGFRTVARMSYDAANALLGPRPDVHLSTVWETCTLQDAAKNTQSTLRTLENDIHSLPIVPVTYDSTVSNQDNGLFLDPFNVQLTALWDTLDQRLHNLRHNLSIDGKELSTPLYETPINPMSIQSKRYQRVVAIEKSGASKFVVPNYRFAPMMNKAMTGVDTLIQFGNTLLSLMERKDSLNFDHFRMTQQLSMYSFTINLQEQAVQIAKAELAVSQAGRAVAEQRYQHYKTLYDGDVSGAEQQAIQLQAGAASTIIAAQELKSASAALNLMPNIFGLAFGGIQWGAGLNAIAEKVMIDYQSMSTKADSLMLSETYRRRRQEWEIQYRQAELELSVIDRQIEVQQNQIKASETQLEQIEADYAQAQTLLDYFSSRFTSESLYVWMTSQLSSLYLKAYDAVMSLCLTTEAAWQYETGQFERSFMQPGIWNDVYQGLLVGETMKLSLMQMEQAFVYQNERRQEITKTLSLKSLDPTAFNELKNTGITSFALTAENFSDYPRLSNLRIKTISISLPALVGPYQDICAILTQNSSVIDNLVSTESKQVVLSHGLDDNGLFTLNYEDERFLPFEGSGVVSEWSLEFSAGQKNIYNTLNDVIIHLRYTART